jgi:hypothetical protein
MQVAAMQELDCAVMQALKLPALNDDDASGISLALGGHGFLL